MATEMTDVKVSCPLCSQSISASEIEAHASHCKGVTPEAENASRDIVLEYNASSSKLANASSSSSVASSSSSSSSSLLASPSVVESATWVCPRCTFRSSAGASNTACGMCGCPRPKTAQGGDAAPASPARLQPLINAPRLVPAPASVPQQQPVTFHAPAEQHPSANIGGGGGGGSGSGGRNSIDWDEVKEKCGSCCKKFKIWGPIVTVILIVTIALLVSCTFFVAYDEYAIAYNTYTMKIDDAVLEEGRHLLAVGDELIKFPKPYQTIAFKQNDNDVECQSRNGIAIEITFELQYRYQKETLHQVLREFGTADRSKQYYSLLAQTAFRNSCSEFVATDFYYKRGDIEASMKLGLKRSFADARANVEIGFVQLLNANFPLDFTTAVDNSQLAQQDKEAATWERLQIVTQAETRLEVSKKDAQTVAIDAIASADIEKIRAGARVSQFNAKFAAAAKSYVSVMNSTSMSVDAFIEAYLENKIMRDADPTLSMTVAFD